MSTTPEPARALDAASIQALIDAIVTPYLRHSQAGTDLDALRRWRPRRTLWDRVRRLQARAGGFRRRSTWQDQHRIVWLEGGRADGEPLLLVHGFGANKENWLLMAQWLGRHYRLVIPDLPGYGESLLVPGADYGLATQARRLERFMTQVGMEDAHLVGNSMGGAIVALLAALAPRRARSLTLMNAAGLPGQTPSPFEAGLREGRNLLIPGSLPEVARLFAACTQRHRTLITLGLTPVLWREMVHRQSLNHHLFRHMLQVQEDPLTLLQQIRCPTLVLWGDHDRVLDVSAVDAFRHVIPTAEVTVFRNVGHLPMLEAPLRTARTLRAFWQRSTLSPAQAPS